MAPRISVQLYSLREETKDGHHAAVIARLAATGYAGVEGAGFYGLTPRDFRTLVEDHGMVVSSNHCGMPTAATLQECIDTHQALGTRFAVTGFWIPEFASVDAVTATADRLAPMVEALAKAGITLCLHNHWGEFTRIDGRLPYDLLLERCPGIRFEIDTYWACNFGAESPARMVERYRAQSPLLHLKDGSFVKDQPMVACGQGSQDFPAILAAADPAQLEWAVVELDACVTDMAQAVDDSYRYLVGKGLATGRRPAR